MLGSTQNFGPICLAVLTFIGYKQTAKFIYRDILHPEKFPGKEFFLGNFGPPHFVLDCPIDPHIQSQFKKLCNLCYPGF